MDERLAGGSLAGAALHHLPHDHFFDRRGVHPGAGDGLANDHGPELGRGEAGETAQVLADRRADGGEDDGCGGVAHGLLRVRAESKIAGIDSTVTLNEVKGTIPSMAPFAALRVTGYGASARLRTSPPIRSRNAATGMTSCFFPAPRTRRARLSLSASRCPMTAM